MRVEKKGGSPVDDIAVKKGLWSFRDIGRKDGDLIKLRW